MRHSFHFEISPKSRQKTRRAALVICGFTVLLGLQACGGAAPETSGPTAADLQKDWSHQGDDQHLIHPKKAPQ
ncbi:hypothetical protein [Ideonella paludis]|uniref:Secreted protein n=1 Tax=Ideonella paludis TaxID=1233411 RepID=A0ABS5DX36_9BURK|nr:hypothetical protein [Ideonella paludis]MBQ0935703.1 hypothetical protein [Ideonella paludis]